MIHQKGLLFPSRKCETIAALKIVYGVKQSGGLALPDHRWIAEVRVFLTLNENSRDRFDQQGCPLFPIRRPVLRIVFNPAPLDWPLSLNLYPKHPTVMYVPVSTRLTVYSTPRRSSFAMNSLSVTCRDLRKISPRRFSIQLPPPSSTGGLVEGANCGCSQLCSEARKAG
jgi:hypothetical protein